MAALFLGENKTRDDDDDDDDDKENSKNVIGFY